MKENETVRYLSIREACAVTGLSQYYLRNGCKDGTIACVKSGKKYYIDVYALMSQTNMPATT